MIPRYFSSVFSEHEKGESVKIECCTALLMIGFHSFCWSSDQHIKYKLAFKENNLISTVELLWLEHLLNYENMFETGVVRAEC